MSKTASALLTKWFAIFIATIFSFRFMANASWTMVFLFSIGVTLTNYLIGDLVILPAMGNVVSSISNGILGIVAALIFGVFSNYFAPTTLPLVVFGVLIAVFDYFFHMYLLSTNKVAP